MAINTLKHKRFNVFNYLTCNLDAFLLALVLNVNVIRFFLGIDDTNLLLYLVYIGCILTLYRKNNRKIKKEYTSDIIFKNYTYFWIFFVLYSLITCALVTYEFVIFIKFLVAIVIGLLCIGEDIGKKNLIFNCFIIINLVYGLIILCNPLAAYNYMGESVNYLNMTLTLGLCLTLSLVKSIYIYFSGGNKKVWPWILLSVFFFLVIMLFPGRGVLLFPPLIALFTVLFLIRRRRGSSRKVLIFTIFLILICILGFQYFQQNASDYALNHMSKLFEDTEEESRIVIWSRAMSEGVERYWIFFGAGINGFVRSLGFYPHNIIMQMLLDFGIVFAVCFVGFLFCVVKRYFKVRNSTQASDILEMNLICFVSFIYYLLTFCKSFSMYDSCPLLIMISLCLSTHKNRGLSSNLKGRHESKI